MKFLAKTLIGATAFAAMAFAPAAANVVTLGPSEIECNDDNDATVDCLGMTGGSLILSSNMVTGGTAGSLDIAAPFIADLYGIGSNSEANEAAALNVLAGTSFTGADGSRTDAGGVDVLSFTTFAEWVVIKMGAGTVFIKNTTGGGMALEIDFSKFSGAAGAAGGFSHYTEFGAAVPIPGAIWLMGAGLAGLGFAGRRKKQA